MNKVERPYTIKAVVNLATIKSDLRLVSTQIAFKGMDHFEKIQSIFMVTRLKPGFEITKKIVHDFTIFFLNIST